MCGHKQATIELLVVVQYSRKKTKRSRVSELTVEHGERRLAGVHRVTTGGDEAGDGGSLLVARGVVGLVLGLDLGTVVLTIEFGGRHCGV